MTGKMSHRRGDEGAGDPVHLLDDDLAGWWHALPPDAQAAVLLSARSDETPPTAADARIWAAVLDSHIGKRLRSFRIVAPTVAGVFLAGLSLHLFAQDETVAQMGLFLAVYPLSWSSWGLVVMYRLDQRRRALLAMASRQPATAPSGARSPIGH